MTKADAARFVLALLLCVTGVALAVLAVLLPFMRAALLLALYELLTW